MRKMLATAIVFFILIFAYACSIRPASNVTSSTTDTTNMGEVTNSTNTTNTNTTSVTPPPSSVPFVMPTSYDGLVVQYTNLSSANYTSFPVSLQPYEFKVILISNLGKSGAIDTSSDWYLDAIVYQVFVRSFYDSDGNGVGDLNGLKQKLDYITNVGFNAIWLLPIFESPSYHGYDINDYYSIEYDYGGMSAFNSYITEARTKRVKTILDMVINHTSDQHPWFVDSKYNRNGKGNWYVWTNTIPSGWQFPWGGGNANNVWIWDGTRGMYYYSAFGYGGMPDLNYFNPSVSNEILKVSSNWIYKYVDGYRLDAARYLIETGPYPNQADTLPTKQFWTAYNNYLRSIKSDFYTVGEVWANNGVVSGYYGTLTSCFNFDFAYSVADVIKDENNSSLVNMINTKPSSVPWKSFAPFLDNHDDIFFNGNRFADEVGGSVDKQKLGAVLLLTFPGTPYVYYGSEIGMRKGSQGGDLGKRTPMQWDSTSKAGFTTGTPWTSIANNSNPINVSYQLGDPNSLLNLYKRLIKIRKVYPSLRRGDFKLINTSDSSVVSYIRIGTNESILVVANLSSSPKNISLDLSQSGLTVSSTYSTYLFVLIPANTNSTPTNITIDGIKESLWYSCKVAGPVTNTSSETLGWDFGGFLGLYITNDSQNLYVAFELLNNAGSYGNNIYFLIDLPSYSYDKTNLLGLGDFTKSNITLIGGFSYDVILFFNAPANGFVGSSNLIIFADGTTRSITNIAVSVSDRFVEFAIPVNELNLSVNDMVRILGFYTGVDVNATAYCAIPFTNGNGGTDGPLPPGGGWNAIVSLNDFSTYIVK